MLQDELDRIQENELDQTAYKRELWAKMYGGKLTNRQYEVLANIVQEGEEGEDARAALQHSLKIEARDRIRNTEEIFESYRRKMVLNGTWTESESTMMLHKDLDDFLERFPTEKDWKIFERENKKML